MEEQASIANLKPLPTDDPHTVSVIQNDVVGNN